MFSNFAWKKIREKRDEISLIFRNSMFREKIKVAIETSLVGDEKILN
jgi:hypothetical protein